MRSCGVIAVLLTAAGCASEGVELPGPRFIAWTTVSDGELSRERHLTGVVQSALRADFGFEVPGRVASVPVEVGDTFDQGQLLASLDRSGFVLQVQQQRALVAAATAALSRAKADFDRTDTLISQKAVTQARYDAVRAEYESAKAQLSQAEASLALAQKALGDTRLVAPYRGVVTARLVDPAEQVQAQVPVLSIEREDTAVELRVLVPETLIESVEVGSEHRVRFPGAQSIETRARVSQVGTAAGAAGSFPVTLTVEDASPVLRAGMTADVAFAVKADGPPGLRIPLTAFVAGGDGAYSAFVYNAELKTVERRTVEVRYLEANAAIVAGELKAGDVIASRGVSFLRGGQPVRLLGDGPERFDTPVRNAALQRVGGP